MRRAILTAVRAFSRNLRDSRLSHLYRTSPVGGPPQPDFLNAVIVRTDLALCACPSHPSEKISKLPPDESRVERETHLARWISTSSSTAAERDRDAAPHGSASAHDESPLRPRPARGRRAAARGAGDRKDGRAIPRRGPAALDGERQAGAGVILKSGRGPERRRASRSGAGRSEASRGCPAARTPSATRCRR